MKRNNSRTENAFLNVSISTITQILAVLFAFINRTVFVHYLNADYLGVNGLFSNILSVLSFAELGIGSAIAFSLYKPIAETNNEKIKAIMELYCKAYRAISLFIFVAGVLVIPFLKYMVKEPPNVKENIYIIYVLFLLDTSLSYLFSYKKTLITASQKDYIVQIYNRIFQLIQIVLQIIFLIITHEFLLYLLIQVICTVVRNIVTSLKADKMYPILKEKTKMHLSLHEVKNIFNNVKALAVHKFCSVVLNGTDNIIISAIKGVTLVGKASNYFLLVNNITGIFGFAIIGMTASVGNLSAIGPKEKIKSVMHQMLLLSVWIYGLIGIGCFLLINDFITIWIGPDYLLDKYTVFALVFSMYINGVQFSAYTMRTTQGIFVRGWWIPLLAAVLNIFLSVWWGIKFGVAGIFIATGVSRLLTTTIADPWLVYEKIFKERPYDYYIKYILESLAVLINLYIQYKLISIVNLSGIIGFVTKFFIIIIFTNIVFLLEFGWYKDCRKILYKIKNICINN